MFRRKSPVTPARDVGNVQGVTFTALPEWMQGGLGIKVGQVPSRLVLPNITPVVEVYRPMPRTIILPGGLASVPMILFVPDGFEWELQSWGFAIDSDATVANRLVVVTCGKQPGGGLTGSFFTTAGNFSQVATTRVHYTIGPVGVAGNILSVAQPGTFDAIVQIPTPIGFTIPGGGGFIRVDVLNPGATDTITGPALEIWQRPAPESFQG